MNAIPDHDLPMSSRATGLIRRYPAASFFIMAFLFSWAVVLPLILARSGILSVELPVEPFQIAGAFAGPTLAALIVTGISGNFSNIRKLLGRCIQWRVGFIWYVIILFGPLLALNAAGSAILGPPVLTALLTNLPLLLMTYALNLILGVILGPLWEEPGWRGVALPLLQRKHGPFIGTVLLGTLWGLWHLPGYFGGWLGPLTISSLFALLVTTSSFSLLMTWVYNNTRGSILLMILFHSASNATISLGGYVLPADLPNSLRVFVFSGWIPAIAYAVSALLVCLFTRGRLSYLGEETTLGEF